MQSRFALAGLGAIGATTLLALAAIAQPPTPPMEPPGPAVPGVTWKEFQGKLPAIGNIDQVTSWKYGRIRNVTNVGADDVRLEIRLEGDRIVAVACPRQPFADLARASRWMFEEGTKPFPTARDWIERQVAFDADASGRIIALASLEPIPRRGRRIAEVWAR